MQINGVGWWSRGASLLFYLVIYLHYSQQVQLKAGPSQRPPTTPALPLAELALGNLRTKGKTGVGHKPKTTMRLKS